MAQPSAGCSFLPTSDRKKKSHDAETTVLGYTLPCYDHSLAEQPTTRIAKAIPQNNKQKKRNKMIVM